jgi:hypothetical protein
MLLLSLILKKVSRQRKVTLQGLAKQPWCHSRENGNPENI